MFVLDIKANVDVASERRVTRKLSFRAEVLVIISDMMRRQIVVSNTFAWSFGYYVCAKPSVLVQ